MHRVLNVHHVFGLLSEDRQLNVDAGASTVRPPAAPTADSDRGTQCLSMCYGDRLAEAGIEPSFGSRGDSNDNALDVIGLFKTEVIRRTVAASSRRRMRDARVGPEVITQRSLEPIGNEQESRCCRP